MLRCPAHEDRLPSLSMTLGRDGQILLHCFAPQCDLYDVLDALGLELGDLFPASRQQSSRAEPLPPRLVAIIRRYQKAKRKERELFNSAFRIFNPTLAHFSSRRLRDLEHWRTTVDIEEKLNAL